jgi:hypothetical protein
MTQEEIQQRSEQIALMKNYEISENKECFKLPNKNGWIRLEEFYTDWNWLMETVAFCKSKIGTPFSLKIAYLNGDINKALMTAEKEAVFIAVSDFAKLYNEGKL